MSVLKAIIISKYYLLAFLLTCTSLSAQTPPVREYHLKAVFLFNFTQFVEWPANAFPSQKSPLIIAVLGEDNFGSYIDELIAGEQINGHPLIIKRYRHINDVKECHILFVSIGEAKKLEQIIAHVKGQSILTVSDSPEFIENGGMIRLHTVNNKIQLQINYEAAKAANLTISSKLLRLAEIVTPKNK